MAYGSQQYELRARRGRSAAYCLGKGGLFPVFNYLLMTTLSVAFLYPFWHVLVLSFSTIAEANKLGLKLWPGTISMSSYVNVFQTDVIITGYKNTLMRTVVGTILTLVSTYLTAYVIARKNLPFRQVITIFILFPMLFGGGLVPNYILVRNLGLLDKIWVLILPMIASPWYIIITRNFILSLPDSLEEAAIMDGASPLVVAFFVFLPLSMPILAVVSLWSAVKHWNAWFDALIYIRKNELMVLQVVLRRIVIQNQNLTNYNLRAGVVYSSEITSETVKAATIIVSILPIVCFYPFLQKYFVKGILIGSIKG